MKWTEEKINILKELNEQNLVYREIAEILGCTTKAVREKAKRLGIKSRYKELHSEIKTCKECGVEFKCALFEKRVFCSRSCSAKFNNGVRIYSEEAIELKRAQFNNIRRVLPKPTFSLNRNFRICKKCSNEFYNSKPKTVCEECRYQYYSIYRPSCEFDFELEQYKNKIENYNLIEEHGLYSPSNKGNNLKGVSRDHMISVKWGFENKISPEIIKHPANCRLLPHKENNIKKTNNSISYEELLKRIENW